MGRNHSSVKRSISFLLWLFSLLNSLRRNARIFALIAPLQTLRDKNDTEYVGSIVCETKVSNSGERASNCTLQACNLSAIVRPLMCGNCEASQSVFNYILYLLVNRNGIVRKFKQYIVLNSILKVVKYVMKDNWKSILVQRRWCNIKWWILVVFNTNTDIKM